MSLTDKRIEEILKEVEPNAVRLPLGWNLFARAIEAEATKPQEPVAWVEVVDRHEGPYNFHGKELLDSGKHNLYTTLQPCQSCAEKQSAIDVWEGRYADLSAKCAELAQAKIYMPARSADAMPKTENGPCNYPYWRILEVTA